MVFMRPGQQQLARQHHLVEAAASCAERRQNLRRVRPHCISCACACASSRSGSLQRAAISPQGPGVVRPSPRRGTFVRFTASPITSLGLKTTRDSCAAGSASRRIAARTFVGSMSHVAQEIFSTNSLRGAVYSVPLAAGRAAANVRTSGARHEGRSASLRHDRSGRQSSDNR